MTGSLAFIIEDDPQLNQIFTITLDKSFSVEAFMDGDSARARLRESVPDLIVLDLNLPGASGSELLKDIHMDPRLTKTRIILATADDRQAEIVRDQADVVLLKPISPGLLRDLADRLNAPQRRTGGRN
jgi:DNA-binding response OmpR family regulator